MRTHAIVAVLLAAPLAALVASASRPSGSSTVSELFTVQSDLTSLEAALKDSDARKRRNAVIGLAKLGSDGAWDLLFARAFSDRSPQVADEVQLQLGSAALDDAMIERLDSREGLRARDEIVRLRIAEALGRIEGAVPAGLFERALKDKDPEVRAAAAHALGLRVRRGRSALGARKEKDLGKLVNTLLRVARKDKSARVRANAIAAAQPLTALLDLAVDDASEIVRDCARTGDPLVRAAATAALDAPSLADLAGSLRSPDRSLATTAADVLAHLGTRAAMEVLALRFVADEAHPLRPALGERIVAHLRSASGLSHGPSAERWRRWVEGLEPDWRSETGAVSESDRDTGGGTTTFYGLRLVSDRVVFLVDMSGSMWDERGGARRKDDVDVELETALRGLPPTARFDIVPYATTPAPWKGELVDASPRNVERAIAAFRGSGLRGQGDLWSALIPVLRDPEVDTVVMLTDGAPSGGMRWNIDLMRTLLADENRFRGVVLHAILFDASKGMQRRWRGIVEDSGGVLRAID